MDLDLFFGQEEAVYAYTHTPGITMATRSVQDSGGEGMRCGARGRGREEGKREKEAETLVLLHRYYKTREDKA